MNEQPRVRAVIGDADPESSTVVASSIRSEADARLIAAAPALLDALREALKWADKDCGVACMNAVQRARAAIAAAEGRS
jgi:hypothetical protein